MGIDYSTVGSVKKDPNEVYLPKVGESGIFNIHSITRIDSHGDSKNFRSQSENFGFHYMMELDGGKFAILNVFKLLNAFKEANVQDGDTIKIDHPGRGEYRVTVKPKKPGEKDQYLKEVEARHAVPNQQEHPSTLADVEDNLGWPED